MGKIESPSFSSSIDAGETDVGKHSLGGGEVGGSGRTEV
jgi:hypothetical protein